MLQGDWFRRGQEFDLPIYVSLAAYFTFGVTGALAGMRRGYDIVGVFVLALITAGGGSLIRDGLLISSGPPIMVTDPRYLVAVALATLATLVLHAPLRRIGRAIAVIDALGLGAFAVYGVQVSMQGHLSLPGAVLGGTITCVGGGVLRDILVRDEPLLFKPGQFYALVAIGGCVLFVALLHWDVTTPYNAALITIGATFVIRILAISFNWRTTALYREPVPPANEAG